MSAQNVFPQFAEGQAIRTDLKASLHEDLTREDAATGPSERSFGITFAIFFALIAAITLWRGSNGTVYWLIAAFAMLALAFLWAAPLRPLNRVWYRLSLALHAIANPAMMGVVFCFAIVPTGLLMRLLGKDPLRLRGEPKAQSYWIDRIEHGTEPGRMKNQF